MIIVSSSKDKITESLEFSIKEIETCKNEFINEADWQKIKEESVQKDNWVDSKDISKLFKKNMTKNIYAIVEMRSHRIFGTYTTKEKAKKELEGILENVGKHASYQMKIDQDIGIIMN